MWGGGDPDRPPAAAFPYHSPFLWFGFFSPREIGNFAIWCKKGPVFTSSPQPVPKPRTISTGLKQLSLQPPAPPPKYVRFHPYFLFFFFFPQSYPNQSETGNKSHDRWCHLVVSLPPSARSSLSVARRSLNEFSSAPGRPPLPAASPALPRTSLCTTPPPSTASRVKFLPLESYEEAASREQLPISGLF